MILRQILGCVVAALGAIGCDGASPRGVASTAASTTLVRSVSVAAADIVQISHALQSDGVPIVIVADASSSVVAALRHDGSLEWRAGGKGRGPGEMLSIRWMGTTGDTLQLYDGRQRKLVMRSIRTGALLAERRLELLPLLPLSTVAGVLRDQSVLFVGTGGTIEALEGAVRPHSTLVSALGEAAQEVIVGFRGDELLRARSGAAAAEMLRPLGKRSGVAVTGDRIVLFDGDTLRYFERSVLGKWQGHLLDMPAVTASHRPTDSERRWALSRAREVGVRYKYFQTMLQSAPPPEQSPLWGNGGARDGSPIVTGGDGTVCLQQFTDPTKDGETWWLRDPLAGTWRAFLLPFETHLLAVHGITILSTRQGDNTPDVLEIRTLTR